MLCYVACLRDIIQHPIPNCSYIMKLRLFTVASILLLTACSSVPSNSITKVRKFTKPDANVITTSSVGDYMIDQGRATTKKHLIVKQAIDGAYYNIPAGNYAEKGFDTKPWFFPYTTKGAIVAGMDVGTALSYANNEICVTSSLGYKDYKCYDAVAEVKEITIMDESNFRQTLIYNGSVGTKINISYREFSGGMARQAFTNNVEYDMEKSNTFSYKGAQNNEDDCRDALVSKEKVLFRLCALYVEETVLRMLLRFY